MENKEIKKVEYLVNLYELQKEAIYKILERWTYSIDDAKKEEKEKIDRYYQKQYDTLMEFSDRLYEEYYNIFHGYFSNKELDALNEKIEYNFFSQKFINEIKKMEVKK